MEKVGTLIRKYVSAPMIILIKKLNQVLRGWANYHRHVVSSEAFSRIDTYVYWQPMAYAQETASEEIHQVGCSMNTGTTQNGDTSSLSKSRTVKGFERIYQVVRICSIGIKRHIKIKAAANPYSPEFAKYFWTRRNRKDSKLLSALSAREFRAQFT